MEVEEEEEEATSSSSYPSSPVLLLLLHNRHLVPSCRVSPTTHFSVPTNQPTSFSFSPPPPPRPPPPPTHPAQEREKRTHSDAAAHTRLPLICEGREDGRDGEAANSTQWYTILSIRRRYGSVSLNKFTSI